MVLAIGVLTLLVLLFALLAAAPLLLETLPAESELSEGLSQPPLVTFPADRIQAA